MLTTFRPRLALLAPVAAIAVLLLLMVACRGSALVSSQMLNPDEAEILAEGRRAALDLSPYVTYTTPTYLLLWPAFLGVLAKLGAPMSLQTAHVLSGLAYVWIAFVGWFVMSRRLGWLVAAVFVLPTFVALLFGQQPRAEDFQSLGTELLPISIIMLGALVLFSSGGLPSPRRLAVACALAGVSIWAKPQVAVLAVALCLVGLLVRRLPADEPATEDKTSSLWRELLIVVAAFVAPTILLLLLMLLQGTLPRFVSEPLAVLSGYVTTRQQLGAGQPFALDGRLADVGGALEGQPLAFVWALPGLLALAAIWAGLSDRMRAFGVWIWLTPLVAAVLTLGAVVPLFTHYLNFLYAACMLSGMAGIAAAQVIQPVQGRPAQTPRSRPRLGQSAALIGALIFGVVASTWVNAPMIQGNVTSVVQSVSGAARGDTTASSTVAVYCPPKTRVLVWGWAAELYAEYDWEPASRYVNSWQMSTMGNAENYKATLFDEITTDPPQCVVQAIGPQFFGLLDQKDSIAARMPNLDSYLATCYEASSEVLPGDRPITLWRWAGACEPGQTGMAPRSDPGQQPLVNRLGA